MCVLSTFLELPAPKMPSDMKNVVGQRIREARYRADRRVTQDELAARLQAMGVAVDRTAISKIEGGSRPITDVEIIAICQALGLTVASLFSGLEGTEK